jgi:hypothetical protein
MNLNARLLDRFAVKKNKILVVQDLAGFLGILKLFKCAAIANDSSLNHIISQDSY